VTKSVVVNTPEEAGTASVRERGEPDDLGAGFVEEFWR
jgi:hypothetical protein